MAEPEAKNPVEEIQGIAQAAANAETTSPLTRRYRTYFFQFMLVATTGAFALLTFLVKTTPSFPIDLAITQSIQSIDFPLFDELMIVISWPGFLPQALLLPAAILITFYVLGLHWETVVGCIAALLPTLINLLLKEIIQRPRPTIDLVDVFRILNSYSFPSGHVMFYVGFFGFLGFLSFTLMKRSWRRTVLLTILGVFILLVGVSRINLGQHWASDVLGAYLLGGLLLAGMIQFYRWGKQRFFVHQPVAGV